MRIDKETLRSSIPVPGIYAELLNQQSKLESGQHVFFCPWHDDRKTPNFKVNKDGRFRCWACGEKGDVFDFYQRMKGVPFKEALLELGKRYAPGSLAETPTAKEPTFFHTMPEDLVEWLQGRGITPESVRKHDLQFASYGKASPGALAMPTGNGAFKLRFFKDNGGPKFATFPAGKQSCLFGLPIEGENVILVEGELDCIRLAQEPTGSSIISVPHGAETFREEWSDAFQGKDVAIIYDRDEAGMRGAKKAARLIYDKATTVRIVVLPEMEDGSKDVSDFLQAGNNATDLMALIVMTPAYEPPPQAAVIPFPVQEKTPPKEAEKGKSAGRESPLQSPEPWDEAVNGVELLDDLVAVFLRYLVLLDGAAEVFALWTLHSHTFESAEITPRLALLAPDKRCGKTRVLEVLQRLVRCPLSTSNTSAAAVFRAIDAWSPTMLIDEGDTFLGDKDDLRGILNSGHSRAMGYVIRVEGEGRKEPRLFPTFAPVAIAQIGKLAPTLEDRSIVVNMHRKKGGESIEKLRTGRTPDLDKLGRMVARWAENNVDVLAEAVTETPDALHDRAADNWEHLLAIADLAGGPWPKKARTVAVAFSGIEGEDSSLGVPSCQRSLDGDTLKLLMGFLLYLIRLFLTSGKESGFQQVKRLSFLGTSTSLSLTLGRGLITPRARFGSFIRLHN